MRMYDLILSKKMDGELSTEEIDFLIENYNKGEIPDYQVAALLMAIYFNGMSIKETRDLTMAIVNSGDIMDLSSIEGIKVDKHSTGGVGDKTTLVLAPMVAALGIPVAKMSGRGLGHTGGTADKLEVFPGFSVEIKKDQFIDNVNRFKLAVAGQTSNLAPADKKLYALRDVTATVDSLPLIAASVMSKKIAAGADAIVLDVKAGDGAFMKTFDEALKLSQIMVGIGNSIGRRTIAVISDMDQPLGYAIGNSLEVIEAINTLKGNGPSDLLELCLTLGSNMVMLGGKANSKAEAREILEEVINNGQALLKFKQMIEAQGGDSSYIDHIEKFEQAKYILPVEASNAGFVNKIRTERAGIISMELGAGRETKESQIDLSVGIVLCKKRGDIVKKGDIIAYIHANDQNKGLKAVRNLKDCYIITAEEPKEVPLILGEVI